MLIFLLTCLVAFARAQSCALTTAQKNLQGNCPTSLSAKTCLNDIVGGTTCTAKDSPVGRAVACTAAGNCDGSTQLFCVNGQTVQLTLNITIAANANRYDVGAYIAPGQTQAKTGYCCRYILSPLATLPSLVRPQSGCGPYANLDTDGCGDVLANVVNYELITLNLLCQGDGGNKLVAAVCTTWDNQGSANCNNYTDLKPGTGSKCKCFQLAIANVDVIPAGLSVAFELDSSACFSVGGNVVFRYRVSNPTTVPLSNVLVSDSLASAISCCADVNSTACPGGFTLGNTIPLLGGFEWRICQSTIIGVTSTVSITNAATAVGYDTRTLPPTAQTATSSR